VPAKKNVRRYAAARNNNFSDVSILGNDYQDLRLRLRQVLFLVKAWGFSPTKSGSEDEGL